MSDEPVLIIVGSESDRARVEGACNTLEDAGVGFDFIVSSAHRHPEQTAKIAKRAKTVGIGNAKNAALLALRILGRN